uniref:Uncharacterized protein n=1 Tax=Rhizophora mucronata TaxID=61149 RepID=A0A2P2KY79_RHIMU
MYAETGLLFPYMQSLSLDNQQLEEYCKYHKTNASLRDLSQSSTISEYDLGGEGDLFKAPEPIIEEPVMGLDPVAAAISMMPCGEEVITMQGLRQADIESIQSEQLLCEALYGCEKDLMEKAAVETSLSEALEHKIPIVRADQGCVQENKPPSDQQLLKSDSLGRLSSMEWMPSAAMKPTFLDFPGMDFGTVYGMRRAFSEGDIQTTRF